MLHGGLSPYAYLPCAAYNFPELQKVILALSQPLYYTLWASMLQQNTLGRGGSVVPLLAGFWLWHPSLRSSASPTAPMSPYYLCGFLLLKFEPHMLTTELP